MPSPRTKGTPRIFTRLSTKAPATRELPVHVAATGAPSATIHHPQASSPFISTGLLSSGYTKESDMASGNQLSTSQRASHVPMWVEQANIPGVNSVVAPSKGIHLTEAFLNATINSLTETLKTNEEMITALKKALANLETTDARLRGMIALLNQGRLGPLFMEDAIPALSKEQNTFSTKLALDEQKSQRTPARSQGKTETGQQQRELQNNFSVMPVDVKVPVIGTSAQAGSKRKRGGNGS